MSKLTVYDMQGASIGEMEIADAGIVLDRGTQAVKEVVTAYRNALRAGTASTLSKGEVAGSNKKPWAQKGTGQAQVGFRQSPVWRGGGVAFGPKPRSYESKVNRKVARLAFRRVLSEKISTGSIKVVESLDLKSPKTGAMAGLIKALGVSRPVLVVADQVGGNLGLACRNIPLLELAGAGEVNVYQLLRYPVVVATRAAMAKLEARLAEGKAVEKVA
jgi:large subunit ribosomal protein L4